MINLLKKISFKLEKKKEIYLVESYEDKEFVESNLEDADIIGIDTEFDWRSTYFPTLCLLQIAIKNKIFLIDCLRFKDLRFLKKILEDKRKLIIFHSSRSDTTVLYTNLGIKIKNVFDIQIAEKKINGGEIMNYGAIVNNYFPVKLDKSETNSNWLKRPFTQNQLAYAANDVNFLIEVFKKQMKILKKKNLYKETYLDSQIESSFGNQDLYISRLKKLKKPSKLEKKIFLWREQQAKKKNIPPSRIFRNKDLKFLTKAINNDNTDVKLISEIIKDSNSTQDFFKEVL